MQASHKKQLGSLNVLEAYLGSEDERLEAALQRRHLRRQREILLYFGMAADILQVSRAVCDRAGK